MNRSMYFCIIFFNFLFILEEDLCKFDLVSILNASIEYSYTYSTTKLVSLLYMLRTFLLFFLL